MTEEKFWKIVYLYIEKYGYEILNYRPEKKDIWLIDSNNEIFRFVYLEQKSKIALDSSIYNIIKNESILKKSFKINSLKIKSIFMFSEKVDFDVEYKKYKISASLAIERIILSEKNIQNFVKKDDVKFINMLSGTENYKNRVGNIYKKNNISNFNTNFHFNFVGILLIFLFSINYIFLNITNGGYSLYYFLDYNFQKIISGQFYRFFTSIVVFDSIRELLIIVIFIFVSSVLLCDRIKIKKFFSIILTLSMIFNIFFLFNYFENVNISSIVFFGFFGSLFILELNNLNNNLKLIYSIFIPMVYLLTFSIFYNISFIAYLLSFILGIFIELIYINKKALKVCSFFSLLIILSGFLIVFFNINLKSKVNNYMYYNFNSKIEKTFNDHENRMYYLEKELSSNRKSILTYYELAILKLKYSSLGEAKNLYLKSLEFDDTFAPTYYELSLIYRAELNEELSKQYLNKALELDPENSKYKDLFDELNNKK